MVLVCIHVEKKMVLEGGGENYHWNANDVTLVKCLHWRNAFALQKSMEFYGTFYFDLCVCVICSNDFFFFFFCL